MEPIEQLYRQYLQCHKVTTDSRSITPGCIFFAFKGETFDGNSFAPQALQQGAALCVISDARYRVDERCIVVEDVLATLQQLARHHRRHLTIPFVGITGTNGKTTTKELVHAVLSKRYRTHATQGNFNNHLGVPLTLLSMPEDTEIAIIEMGANHPGEIAFLCDIAQPTHGLITNVGRAHLEGFGGFEGVVRTKTELYRHLAAHGGTLMVNTDNARLMEEAGKVVAPTSVISYGSDKDARVKGSLVGSEPYMKFYLEEGDNVYPVQTHLLGNYNFDNAMAAAAVGRYFKVDPFDIKEALEAYTPSNNRSQYKSTEHNVLFLDCYNANPSSMQVAVDNFAALRQPHKVVMLGGMRELGSESELEHRKLVERLSRCDFERVVLVGGEFHFVALEHLQPAPDTEWYASSTDALQHYSEHRLTGATVLLKGSNSNRMWLLEEVL